MVKSELNWPKIGNEKAVEFLSRAIIGDRIAQTYIFIGSDDLGKSTVALAFARNLMGEALESYQGFNSDLHILKSEDNKKSISIEQVRVFIKDLSLSSFLDSYKIGIIKEADSLTNEAQNAILKTLEEPRDKVIVILLARSEDNLLPTILSRGQKLYFNPVKAEIIYDYLLEEHKIQRSLAKDLANIALGRPLKAVRFLENPELYAAYLEKASVFLKFFDLNVNDRLSDLDKLFTDKTYSVSAVAGAEEILMMAEGLMRDLFLLHFNQPEKIQHSALASELNTALQTIERISISGPSNDNFSAFLLERFKLAALAHEYLSANINPRLVLEQLVINL
ncbi:MAG: AAA family ATPase [Patescibacteria group bacterium]